MSKLPEEHQFVDLSDYGRPIARLIANSLKRTNFTPIHVTVGFIISGLIAIYSIVLILLDGSLLPDFQVHPRRC